MLDRAGFVEAILAAPVGVVVLGVLEGEARDDVQGWEIPTDSRRGAVLAAADAVRTRSFGALVALAVDAACMRVGPWIPSASTVAAEAYRHAEARLPIAEAIDERFATQLHRPLDLGVQQWWNSVALDDGFDEPRFRAFGSVYGAGQFTWAGLWTVTEPPPEAHGDLASAWEMDPYPISRWQLPVRRGVRIVEIHRPRDWVALVARYPAAATVGAEGWELPGVNQETGELADLMSLARQHAARTSIRRHLVPDWGLVAADHDGVHLSWAGFLTSEGHISDLGGGDVAMLRYWFSERTLWLRDCFGEPEPLDAPHFDTDGTNLSGVDVRTDVTRRRRDRDSLRIQLGR